MLVQVLLVAVVVAFLVRVLSTRATHSTNAWKKIGILLLVVMMVLAVIFPDTTTYAANLLSIGRGADLLLYALFAAFIFTTLNQYIKDQDRRDVTYRLARQIAILEAKDRYGIN